MLDFTVQDHSLTSPPVLSPNTLTEFGSHPETLDALLPWLTDNGEPVFVQIEEEDIEFGTINPSPH